MLLVTLVAGFLLLVSGSLQTDFRALGTEYADMLV